MGYRFRTDEEPGGPGIPRGRTTTAKEPAP
ncbi:hypothetical protein SAMN05444521_2060 [Streptomyces sp. 3214.6]|nr:hypothetical protein SAMN05444521_2060 [Streptomyces sp. 3214.6]